MERKEENEKRESKQNKHESRRSHALLLEPMHVSTAIVYQSADGTVNLRLHLFI